MKIKNMNQWLPKPYYAVWHNGRHHGNYTNREEAEAEHKRLVDSEPPQDTSQLPCGEHTFDGCLTR